MCQFRTNQENVSGEPEVKLNSMQKDLLLSVVAYYMDQNLRQKLKQELPLAYEAWMSQRIKGF